MDVFAVLFRVHRLVRRVALAIDLRRHRAKHLAQVLLDEGLVLAIHELQNVRAASLVLWQMSGPLFSRSGL